MLIGRYLSRVVNSSAVIPAAFRMALKVPRSSSSCIGTVSGERPGHSRRTWLPRWRTFTYPRRDRAAMHCRAEIRGGAGTPGQAATVTSTSSPLGSSPDSRHSAMASRMLASASSRVLPCETHPDKTGHSATIQPSSPGRRTTGNVLTTITLARPNGRGTHGPPHPAREGAAAGSVGGEEPAAAGASLAPPPLARGEKEHESRKPRTRC